MAALTTKRREAEVEKAAKTLITRHVIGHVSVTGHLMRAVKQWGG